jgi:rhodanese-related sulfurtransferase
MKTILQLAGALVLGSVLASCSEDQSSAAVEQEQPQAVAEIQDTGNSGAGDSDAAKIEAFTPEYISAQDLNTAFEKSELPYVFDVRSEPSYEKSHIQWSLSMPYGNTDEARLAGVQGLTKQSPIVTYCGCPRHLSTLSAEALGKQGYQNVRVLYEGFWHWKDIGFPIVDNEATTSITILRLEGILTEDGEAADNRDVFLRHQKTGQLEAVRVSADGEFKVDFHLYDYQDGDNFEIILDHIENQSVRLVVASREPAAKLNLNL